MLTFSNVVALMALFFALGGSVYAAAGRIDGSQIKPKSIPGNRLEAKSISTGQLKAGAVSAAQLKAGSIAAGKLKKGSLTGKQVKAESLTGAQIQKGSLTGKQVVGSSLTGVSAAAIGTVQYVTSTVNFSADSEDGTSTAANCPAGMYVIGGGASVSDAKFAYVNESAPTPTRTGWTARGFGLPSKSIAVTAICTPVTGPTG
ncbi:MAG: hypothetical protein AB7V58_00995 [Solirubrobacterales bacterium]